ncbi:hypothetical protein L195_g047108 [Trifolium pratense]|uniref:Uncharacterized protein n=1 Tax=Trifolium pratense TaxID=57577 RepID=A0A2K3MJW0_TRIPR|nr:hypothetical protein L195_g047108 [Trifolium pratense]
MAAMDMPIAAVWDKQEWSTKIVDKEIESADKEMSPMMLLSLGTVSTTTVAAVALGYHDNCVTDSK